MRTLRAAAWLLGALLLPGCDLYSAWLCAPCEGECPAGLSCTQGLCVSEADSCGVDLTPTPTPQPDPYEDCVAPQRPATPPPCEDPVPVWTQLWAHDAWLSGRVKGAMLYRDGDPIMEGRVLGDRGTWTLLPEFTEVYDASLTTEHPADLRRVGMGASRYEGLSYIFGGLDAADRPTDTLLLRRLFVYEEEPRREAWPSARLEPTMAHGGLAGGFFLYGGEGEGGALLSDVWSFEVDRGFTQLAADAAGGPGARRRPGVAGHDCRQETRDGAVPYFIIYGGEDASGRALDGLWAFRRRGGWIQLDAGEAATPGPRVDAAMVVRVSDPRRCEDPAVYLHGGAGAPAGIAGAGLWRFDLVRGGWERILGIEAPAARAGADLLYEDGDPAQGRLANVTLIGGDGPVRQYFFDRDEWDVYRTRPVPPGAAGHGGALSRGPGGDSFYIYGREAFAVGGELSELWRFDLTAGAWRRTGAQAPEPPSDFPVELYSWDTAEAAGIVGIAESHVPPDAVRFWRYTVQDTSWSAVEIGDSDGARLPEAWGLFGSARDDCGQLFIYGGESDPAFAAPPLFRIDPEAQRFERMLGTPPSVDPFPHLAPSLIYEPRADAPGEGWLHVIGGELVPNGPQRLWWRYDVAARRWEVPEVTGRESAPEASIRSAAAFIGGHLVHFGGDIRDGPGVGQTLHLLDPRRGHWRRFDPPGDAPWPLGRQEQVFTASPDGRFALLHGGLGPSEDNPEWGLRSDLWRLELRCPE